VVRALKESEFATLCTVPGIGKKTAERMVLELKDKFGDLGTPGTAPSISPVGEQAVQALVNLGFSPGEADRAVKAALATDGASGTAEVIRGALQLLTNTR
jgi:Holliday junction DNA helicase RuvA